MSPMSNDIRRPGLFVLGVLLQVLRGFFLLGVSCVGLFGLWLAIFIGLMESNHDDEVVSLMIGLILGTLALGLFFFLAVLNLFLAFKAWGMSRFWLWGLILFSLLTMAFDPCPLLFVGVTVIGCVLALERVPRAG
ncbi:MAG: hypothetical protein O7B99_08795 [Planctomycetota bacterium]|nr:hypothetical protein [Planctomycetota bacterium]